MLAVQDDIAELLELKDAAIRATAAGDGAFYEHYLADDAVALTPRGKLDKAAIVKAMTGSSGFRSLGVEDVDARLIGPDTGLVTYRARFAKPDGGETAMLTSTVYCRRNGDWRGVFYQQTPTA